MSKPTPAWLILVVILIQIAHHRAAFILSNSTKSQPPSRAAENSQTPGADGNTSRLREQFIILSTGEQIKLYKFDSTSDIPALLHDYWLVRPIEFDDEKSRQLEENSFSRWLLSRPLSKPNRRKSILPPTQEDDQDYGGDSGWNKPWITHVDYFFSKQHCDSHAPQCLVVVWLDKGNNYIRYGSVPFPGGLARSTATASGAARRAKILWLREFPPIDIFRNIKTSGIHEARAHAMVVDRQRHRLHVILSNGESRVANRLLSGVLRTDGAKSSADTQLDGERIFTLLRHNPESSEDGSASALCVGHLNVDETDGNWLFFLEGRAVFTSNVDPADSENRRVVLPILPSAPSDGRSPAAGSPALPVAGELAKMESGGSTMGIAVNKVDRKLFWLDELTNLFSSQYTGSDFHQEKRLSLKPVIKLAESIQVFRDAIYMSDSIKKSLLVYRLTPSVQALRGRESEDSIRILGEQVDKDSYATLGMKASGQQVLLVEMPTILGFRVFELEEESLGSQALAIKTVPLNVPVEETISIVKDGWLGARAVDDLPTESSGSIRPDAQEDGLVEINPIEPLFNEEANDKTRLACLVRLAAYGELLLGSILLITCFVVLSLLIRMCRQQRQQEIKAILVKNCSI